MSAIMITAYVLVLSYEEAMNSNVFCMASIQTYKEVEMKKILATMMMALFLAASISGTAIAAKSVKCTVTSVKDSIVTMDCGEKADKLAVGSTVKVKTAKKKAIEGC